MYVSILPTSNISTHTLIGGIGLFPTLNIYFIPRVRILKIKNKKSILLHFALQIEGRFKFSMRITSGTEKSTNMYSRQLEKHFTIYVYKTLLVL